ncbi:MAG: hypothetical protein ACUVX8_08695 [Candidatus Zipacnadales bacterium]
MSDLPNNCRSSIMHVGLALIVGGGLALRWAVIPDSPVIYPVDAIYYRDVGRNIAAGRGIVIDYAWIYIRGIPDSLPLPANGYWMPGMAFYAAAWFGLLGPTALASKLICLSLASAYLLAVWWLAKVLTDSAGAALFATALAAVEPNLLWLAGAPDACVAQGALTAATFICMDRGLRQDARWLFLAGGAAGAAHLMRNDGVLLLGVFGVCLAHGLRVETYRFQRQHLGWFLVPYTAVVAPWLIRNTLVFGSPWPPALWRLVLLTAYEDIFRADLSAIDLGRWLAYHGGWGGALCHSGFALLRLLQWVAFRGGSSLVLAALVFQLLKRSPVSRSFLYLLGMLTVGYGLILPEVGLNGGFTRGYMSVLPWVLAAAAGGVWTGGEWLATRIGGLRRRGWIVALVLALLAHTVVRASLTVEADRRERAEDPYLRNASQLRAFFTKGPDISPPVLTDNPWVFHALTDMPCAMLPTDGMDAVLEVGRRLNARYVVLSAQLMDLYPGLREATAQGTLLACQHVTGSSLRIYTLPPMITKGASKSANE